MVHARFIHLYVIHVMTELLVVLSVRRRIRENLFKPLNNFALFRTQTPTVQLGPTAMTDPDYLGHSHWPV